MTNPAPPYEKKQPLWVVTGGTGLVGENLLDLLCTEFYKDEGKGSPNPTTPRPLIRASFRDAQRIKQRFPKFHRMDALRFNAMGGCR
jgi:nucleoside-diphosphate-sugar epimerase